MATNDEKKFTGINSYEDLLDQLAALRATLIDQNAGLLIENPQQAEAINQQINDLLAAFERAERLKDPPPDRGLGGLVGIGPEAARDLGEARAAPSVTAYDEVLTPERINAVADLYYIFQHEMLGVWRVTLKLQELFKAGVVRLSRGTGAFS